MFDAVLAWSQVGNWPWWGVNSQGGFELTNGTNGRTHAVGARVRGRLRDTAYPTNPRKLAIISWPRAHHGHATGHGHMRN